MTGLRLGPRLASVVFLVAGCTSGGGLASGVQPPHSAYPPSSVGTASASVVSSAVAPTAAPLPTPTPPPFASLNATYSSRSYGYTIAYPKGWTTTNGLAPWPAHTVLMHNDPHLDVIRGPVRLEEARFIGASQPLPAGTTNEQFLQYQGQVLYSSPCGPGGDSAMVDGEALPKPVEIDGLPALADLDGCGSWAELGGLIWDVVVVTPGGRGYNFTFDGALHANDVVAWLRTIKLDPGAAVGAQ